MSCTINEQVAELPDWSNASYFTEVDPSGNVFPDWLVDVTLTTSTLSENSGSFQVMAASDAAIASYMFPGQ